MKKQQYRITVEHRADADGKPVNSAPLQFDAPNHDDIFAIVDLIGSRHNLPPETAKRFAVGLKLMTEAMMENREHPLFAALKPHVGDMMKIIKSKE